MGKPVSGLTKAISHSGRGQSMPDTSGNTPADVLAALGAMREPSNEGKRPTLREIGKRLNLNPGYLSAIMRGRKAPSPRVYHALGLRPPRRVVEIDADHDVAPVCPKCGQVHTTKTCALTRRPRRPDPLRPRRVRGQWVAGRHVVSDQI